MSGKEHMTFDQHRELGDKLKMARDALSEALVKAGEHYPLNSKAHRKALKAYNAVNELRCELDNRVCTENPDTSNHEVCACYYGAVGAVSCARG